MNSRLEKIDKLKQSIESICRKLQWVFFAIFAVYIIAIIAISIYAILLPLGLTYVGPDSFIAMIPIVCNVLAGGFVLLTIGIMLRTIGKGDSPFNLFFVKCFIILGVLLAVGFVSGLLIPPGTVVGVENNSMTLAYSYPGSSRDITNFDMTSLIASISCFVLSAVFRYGAVLQTEVDDLL